MIPVLVYAILFILVDSIYLSYISGPYGDMIKKIQGEKMVMKIAPAIVVYLSLVGAWYIFIYNERDKYSYFENIKRAGLLGFFIYSVYDFTNMAIIKDYSLYLAIIDSLWGGILYMITTALLTSMF